MAGYSPKLPVLRDSEDGYMLTKTPREFIAQNLKNLVLTSPGEKMMNVDFGVGIRNYLFQQDTPPDRQTIKLAIQEQVGKYLPYITLNSIDIHGSEVDEYNVSLNSINLIISYNVFPLNLNDVLEINISPS